ncbi:MAG: hypothetical protein RL318_861 [Fibrobacterota bacterium]|jgi:hypothetical protein
MKFGVLPGVRVLASLRLALFVMGGLVASLAAGTLIESRWNADLAQMLVYRSVWFQALLGLLFLNVALAVVVRLPLRRSQTGFAVTHLGIMLLLGGAALTKSHGVEGMLVLEEGESSATLRLSQPVLRQYQGDTMAQEIAVPRGPWRRAWALPGLEPIASGTRIEEVLPFVSVREWAQADPDGSPLLEAGLATGGDRAMVDFRLGWGNPMVPSRQSIDRLDVVLMPVTDSVQFMDPSPRDIELGLVSERPTVRFGIWNSQLLCRIEAHGKVSRAFVAAAGIPHETGFGAVKLVVGKWLPKGRMERKVEPVWPSAGQTLPPSAVRLSKGPWGDSRWLVEGETIHFLGESGWETLGYELQRVLLPFAVRLDSFEVTKDPGTEMDAGYRSMVTVLQTDGKAVGSRVIAMNEPLHHMGFTCYQASFLDAGTGHATSIFSVNRDPGRTLKYLGCLVLVCGIGLFLMTRRRTGPVAGDVHA